MTAASPPAPGAPDARFGGRALFAGAALLLVAVPFGLLLVLVEGRLNTKRRLFTVVGGSRFAWKPSSA